MDACNLKNYGTLADWFVIKGGRTAECLVLGVVALLVIGETVHLLKRMLYDQTVPESARALTAQRCEEIALRTASGMLLRGHPVMARANWLQRKPYTPEEPYQCDVAVTTDRADELLHFDAHVLFNRPATEDIARLREVSQ